MARACARGAPGALQRVAQEPEVGVERRRGRLVQLALAHAAAEEVGDVLRADAEADVLKVDRRDVAPIGREAQVGDLGVPVHERREARAS